ncbi:MULTISPECIES: metal-sensitive transcriptional regulator [Demequina]|uniref:metal-sensitive transcriptional regulator n=1 Tax=Demequina TaxID=577469 RepID=UPI00078484F6|nr:MULTISPECIES: metal-sensitive transcriptional regulator [Demequina]
MELDAEQMRKVSNRLKRAQGQLAGVIRRVDEGGECEDIVIQLAAVSKALDRAGFAVMSAGIQECMTENDAEARQENMARLEKVFMALA